MFLCFVYSHVKIKLPCIEQAAIELPKLTPLEDGGVSVGVVGGGCVGVVQASDWQVTTLCQRYM